MKIIPVITEKTTNLAKNGVYTFRFLPKTGKFKAKKIIEDAFGVHIVKINSVSEHGGVKTTIYRKKKTVRSYKKFMVVLADKEKIDIFETKGK